MSNETLQSSQGTAIKANIKLMGLVIRASVERIERVVLSGDYQYQYNFSYLSGVAS